MSPARIFQTLLWCFPKRFRHEYGDEMVRAFSQELKAHHSRTAQAALWLRSIVDILTTAPQEHLHLIHHDVRYAFRTLRAQPGFTAVAILSLALGIGANAAIFSLVNTVLLGLLPVRNPAELVLLTDGVSRGTSTGSTTGDRGQLTHQEFIALRDRTNVFSHLMVAHTPREPLNARVQNGEVEQITPSLVSDRYFETLGVPAMLGRTFGPADGATPTFAVISHAFWLRRLGGSDNALGATITLPQAVFTIIGIMPPAFFGETVGDWPDVWLPVSQQPRILPGRDWLHDDPKTLAKTIWLHAYARLRPGVSLAQAQAAANTVFQQELSTYYAAAPPETRRGFLNQRLRLRPAATGGSSVRDAFGEPLKLMLAAAALVLLIACANLGNLMLTRATARTRESAVRQALGAGRGALARQWFTESLLLALAGGVVGLGAAVLMRAALLRLVPNSIRLSESLDSTTLLFTFALTLAAGLLLGVLPALRTLRINATAGLREQGRGLTGSTAWLRAGQLIVAGQVALSLPLLVGAGLLVRTLENLQRVDYGFNTEKLLMVRADVMTAGYEEPRRQALFERLHQRVRQVPGVVAASYSPHGMLMGGDSGDEVEVEGYTRTGRNDQGSRYDPVGPGFFSTLGVPVKLGRAIDERDHAGSLRVCVINEAFAKLFFAGRNPLGQHVTQTYGHQRNTYQVIGVVGNARKRSLRGEIEHRFYFPVSQPVDVPERVTFAIRTAGDPAALIQPVRRALLAEDPNLPVNDALPLTRVIDQRLVQDRLLARLSLAFGLVALLLAAIGLYGVLSYGVSRRTNEIGIRKALGAREGTVVAMILRESTWLLASGLLAGALLAYGSLRWIESRLFGLTPSDPITFAAAALVLTLVGLAAAWLPARRASRVDPLVAIRHE